MKFAHEDLLVWQKAVDFAVKLLDLIEENNLAAKHRRLSENLEAAVTSIASNIAEGKGRRSKKEFVQYLYIARGSLYETVTSLEILKRKAWISNTYYEGMITIALEIAAMLKGLINSVA